MAFKVSTLTPRDITRAYTLMERVMPGLDLEQWIAATATIAPRAAWFVAKDNDGYVRGICHVAVRGEGDLRRQLEVPLIITVSLTESQEMEDALYSAARAFGVRQSCVRVHVWTAIPSSWTVLVDYLDHGPWDHGLIYDIADEIGPRQPIRPVKM